MSNKILLGSNNDLITEACAWIAQLESESMKSDDLAAFKEWVERSPAHKKEIKRLAYLSSDLNVLTDMALPLRAAADKRRKISSLDLKLRKPNLQYLTGIICLCMVFFFSEKWIYQNDIPVNEPLLYTTVIGEHREILLSDGTILDLNTDSEIEVDYSLQRRKVRLIKGEAFFEVAHNTNRPFIVYAGENSVRAVGTAFVVRLMPKKFEVTVTEGKIKLSQKALNEPIVNDDKNQLDDSIQSQHELSGLYEESIFLEAGEKVVYDKSFQNYLQDELVETVSERDIKRMLSWQDGLLDFSDTPLIEVINDLSRYTSMKIEISDPELRELKFGGLFRTNELQALFDALETTYDIKIERINERHVRISRISDVNNGI
jgi:transmembrane sensor